MKTPPPPFLPCKYLRLFTPLPVFRHGNTQEYESHISNQLQISPCVNILDSLTHFHFPVSSHLLPPPEFTGIWNPKLDLPWISNETAWIKLFSGQNISKYIPKNQNYFMLESNSFWYFKDCLKQLHTFWLRCHENISSAMLNICHPFIGHIGLGRGTIMIFAE